MAKDAGDSELRNGKRFYSGNGNAFDLNTVSHLERQRFLKVLFNGTLPDRRRQAPCKKLRNGNLL